MKSVTVRLPEPLYQQLQKRAEQAQRSVEDELVEVVTAAVPLGDDLPADLVAAISPLAALDDEALWRAAQKPGNFVRPARVLALSLGVAWLACSGEGAMRVSGAATSAGGGTSTGSSTSSGSTSSGSTSSSSGTCTATCSTPPCCSLSERFGQTGATIQGTGILADPATGDLLVRGVYSGPADLGTGPLPHFMVGQNEASEAFIARYDVAGHPRWAKGYAEADVSVVATVWAGFSGPDVLALAYAGFAFDFGCGPTGDGRATMVRLDGASGSCLWSQTLFGPPYPPPNGEPLTRTAASASGGDVIVIGDLLPNVAASLGCGLMVEPSTHSTSVTRIAGGDGSCVWSRSFAARGWAIAVDTSSDVYVAGTLQGSMTFGGKTLTGAGTWDGLLVKYDADGNELWGTSFGAPAQTVITTGVAVGADQRPWITGRYSGTVPVGGQTLGPAAYNDVYLAAFASDGTASAVTSFASTALFPDNGDPTNGIERLAVDSTGALVLTGNFAADLRVGDDMLTTTTAGAMFLAKIDPGSLVPVWATSFGSSAWDFTKTTGGPLGIGVDAMNRVLLTGTFTGPLDLGCCTMTPLGSDLFLARVGP